MSKITGIWKRRLRPILLTSFRRLSGLGMPTPRRTATVTALAEAGRCRMHSIDRAPRRTLPTRATTGDRAAVALVRARIDNDVARESFDRLLRGDVVHPPEHSFVATLEEGCVTHDAGIVMVAGEAVLEDVSGLVFASDTPTNPLRLPLLPRPRRTPETVAVLSTGQNQNYYHWFLEALPRLDLYERSGVVIDRYYAPLRHRFQRESLALLGIRTDRIVPAASRACLAPDRLVVSSLSAAISRMKTDFLFRRFTAHSEPPAGSARRIFITRRGARSIVNERSVMRALRKLGFQSHRLEGMRLVDQIGLFSQAECVIAPHGAGLTNLVFCRPGTKVIEIGTPYRPWACFHEIAHHRELDYRLHLASPARIRHFDPRTAVGDSDLMVDPAAVLDLAASVLADNPRRHGRTAA